jgi:two-component system cell cycle sensor histidine kinase/response regulator CckA
MTEPAVPYSRVLVVDDEESIRNVVDRVLREAGYETRLVSNGPEALRLLASELPFDLLLTDLVMPEMSGDELARRARLSHPDLKVLYLTGYSDKLFSVRPMLWQHEAFIDKPVSVDGLREAVSMAIFGSTCRPT